MDLILMRVMLCGALASSSAVCRQDKLAAVSLVARLGTLEWSVLLGLGASPEVIFLGVKIRQKDHPVIPKLGENSSFFCHRRVVNFSPFFLFGKRVETVASIKWKSVWGCSALWLSGRSVGSKVSFTGKFAPK
jgi:hypothetical protein